MNSHPFLASFLVGTILCLTGYQSALAQPILATGLDAAVTEDGLHRVDPSIMAAAWVRPDLDLTRYTKILFMPTAVQFREVVDRAYTARSIQTEFPVSDAMKARLRELWGERFYEDLAEVKSYEMSDEAGHDVLAVQGRLVDVISGVPPDVAASTITTVRWAWEVGIILELRDSISNEILARTISRRREEGTFNASMVWVFTPSMVRRWSLLLCGRLEQLSDLKWVMPELLAAMGSRPRAGSILGDSRAGVVRSVTIRSEGALRHRLGRRDNSSK